MADFGGDFDFVWADLYSRFVWRFLVVKSCERILPYCQGLGPGQRPQR